MWLFNFIALLLEGETKITFSFFYTHILFISYILYHVKLYIYNHNLNHFFCIFFLLFYSSFPVLCFKSCVCVLCAFINNLAATLSVVTITSLLISKLNGRLLSRSTLSFCNKSILNTSCNTDE